MLDVLVMLCAAGAGDCLPRYVPTMEATCDAAIEAAEPRRRIWREAGLVERSIVCAQIDVEPLHFEEVTSGLFVHMGLVEDALPQNLGAISNISVIVGDNSVAIIDSGGSRAVGERLLASIRQISDKPISHLILTHFHPDHVFGADIFADLGVEIVGHAALNEALAARAEAYSRNMSNLIGTGFLGSGLPSVTLPVTDSLTLDLGNRPLELKTWPLAHTSSDMTVTDTASGTLIAGDLLFHDHTPAIDGSIRGWERVMESLKDQDVRRVVPGHGGPVLPWPAGAEDQDRYFATLTRDIRVAIDEGQSLAEAAETAGMAESGFWRLFDLFNPRNATVVFTELEWE